MAMMDLISAKEMDMITRYIDSYATFSRARETSYLLREWNRAKEQLHPIFGDNLILTKEVKIEKSLDELKQEMGSYVIDGAGNDFYCEFTNICYKKRTSNDMMISDMGWHMLNLLAQHNLATNVYEGPTFSVEEPEWEKPIKVQTGARITRILGKLATAYGLKHFEKFRVAHGQVLNQKETHGKLSLSIHPLDYMTMSDNASGWSSCMNWQNDGCYRQGTIEMMNSPCVVVAYLSAATDMDIPGGTWNNKKWRELYIVTPEMISNIKSYPYYNQSLTLSVMEWLEELTHKCQFGNYDTGIITYHPWDTFEINNKKIYIDPTTSYMYNDFSDEREQYGIFDTTLVSYDDNSNNYFNNFNIHYSGCPECMACGELNIEVSEEVCLVGECCEEAYYCTECGDRYSDPDNLTEVDGAYLCEYCIGNRCDEDTIYNELHMSHNLVTVHLATNEQVSRYSTISIYNEHFDDPDMMKRYFKRIYRSSSAQMFNSFSTVFVYIDDCTWEGLELFGFENAAQAYEHIDLDNAHEFVLDADNKHIKQVDTPYNVRINRPYWMYQEEIENGDTVFCVLEK